MRRQPAHSTKPSRSIKSRRKLRSDMTMILGSASAVCREMTEVSKNETRWRKIAAQILHARNDGMASLRSARSQRSKSQLMGPFPVNPLKRGSLDYRPRKARPTETPCGMPRRRVAYGHRRMPHRGKQGPTTAGSARVIRESWIQKSRIWAINPYCFQRCAGQNGSLSVPRASFRTSLRVTD